MMMKKVVPILLLACLVFSSYGAIMCSVGLTEDSLDTAAPDKKPVVFWKSQPVLPNDTVYVVLCKK